ncbi:MAG: hypothetical protein HC858_04405 [Brachymonas sp.]|nr:hypothetical protein [Brachymonas sp.]
MAEKLEADLRRRAWKSLSREHPGERLAFIVTLRAGAQSSSIEQAGMQIEHRIDDPPLLMGTMTAGQALAVARLDGVALVEEDERGVHAIDSPD